MTQVLVCFFRLDTPGLLCYKLNSHPRGLCVLINNLNFQNKTENRNGSQFDERGVKDLFSELSFTVSSLNDLSHDKMRKAAVDFASKDHSQFDAFVFVVMSHGGERDIIYGVDGRTTRVEDLMSEFKALNCPTLRNKPKLFFIQTCRGTTEDKTFLATTGNSGNCMDAIPTDSTLPRSVCPQEADFLLAFATAPGYVAWRNQQSGSFFVQVSLDTFFVFIKEIIFNSFVATYNYKYEKRGSNLLHVDDNPGAATFVALSRCPRLNTSTSDVECRKCFQTCLKILKY